MTRSWPRLALFCCASAALIATALLGAQPSPSPGPIRGARARGPSALGDSGRSAASVEPRSEDGAADPTITRALAAERAAIRSTAHVFLDAFSRYEVDDLSPSVRHWLRRTATSGFAATLFAAVPRPAGVIATPARARVESLDITLLGTVSPPMALVQGTAIRAGQREPFSFTFERRGRGWLAAGVGR